jgi:hypothetical protein
LWFLMCMEGENLQFRSFLVREALFTLDIALFWTFWSIFCWLCMCCVSVRKGKGKVGMRRGSG